MAVNPLIVFVGLSVATLGGLVAVTQYNKKSFPETPVSGQKQPATLLKATGEAAKAPEATTADKKAAVKKMASLPAAEKAATKTSTSGDAKTPGAKPDAPATPVAPTFDVVRIEEDGGAVVVGKAAPGAEVSLKLNGKVIGQAQANENGDWVFVPDQLVPKGNHELIVEATGKNNETVRSKQSIFIAMPKNAREKPLIVVSRPDAPTRVLQKPEAKPQETKTAAKPQVVAEKSKTAMAKVELAKEPVKIQNPVVNVTEKTAAKAVTPAKPAAKKPDVKKVASLPAPSTEKTPMAKPLKAPEQPAIAQPKTKPSAIRPVPTPLTFGTVDYNDQGEIVFSGTATTGKTVRLYVDNQFAGETLVGKDGNWVFRGQEQIKPGGHELRADQVDATGRVSQRTAVPFVRANPVKVAALLKTRRQVAKPVAKPVTKTVTQSRVPTPQASTAPAPQVPAKTSPQTPVVVASKPVEKAPIKKPDAVKTAKVTPEPVVTETATQPAPQKLAAKDPVSVVIPAPVSSQQPKKEKPPLVSHVIIQPGNNLWNISRVIYGKGVAYTTIYQANKKQIKNPDRIYPGQILTTPGATSSGSIGPKQREPLNPVAENNGTTSN